MGVGRSIAASWYVSDLPAPVGITASVSRPASAARTTSSCPRPEVVEAVLLPQRGAEILARHPNECTVGVGTLRDDCVPSSAGRARTASRNATAFGYASSLLWSFCSP